MSPMLEEVRKPDVRAWALRHLRAEAKRATAGVGEGYFAAWDLGHIGAIHPEDADAALADSFVLVRPGWPTLRFGGEYRFCYIPSTRACRWLDAALVSPVPGSARTG